MRALICLVILSSTACTDPQRGGWGYAAILDLKTPPDDPNLACGVQIPPDTTGDARSLCTFTVGDKPDLTLGIGATTANAIPIRHVIVMMKENRSFDHLFGKLHDHVTGVDAVPDSYANPDLNGVSVPPTHATTTCISPDPGHQSQSMMTGVDNGLMDGFVKNAAMTTGTDGHYIMQYNDDTDVPFYYWLAETYAINQTHFAPLVSGTYADRNFMLFGNNAGAVDTGIVYPSPSTPSLLHLLMNAGNTWASYTDGAPFSGSLDWGPEEPGVHPLNDLFDALDKGTLPNVAFVDGVDSVDDDHPVADLQKGEAWVKKIYDHALTSPQWQRLAIIWVYDEGGGFPDHVTPDQGCRSDPSSPFVDRGVRVPLVAISPWARRGFVSNVHEDHTAITRFIATIFGLPALSARDANSPALLDLFDFSCGRDLSVGAAPDGGTGGCANPP